MSETLRGTYNEQLVEWGRSGSLYPNLIPDGNDYEQLRCMQERLLSHFPDADPIEELHATIFYTKPRSLYEYMSTNINPRIREDWLYMDLVNNFSTAALLFRGLEMHTVGLHRFGDDSSMVALQLKLSPESSLWINDLRQLVKTSITRNGATPEELAIMEELPEYRWLLRESIPHISLLKLKSSTKTDIPYIEPPSSIRFNSLASGSVAAPEEDALRWYLMPDIKP